MVFGRNRKNETTAINVRGQQDQKEIPHRIYYDPVQEAMEQRLKREIALKHKAGDLWRARHVEELIGILRDPNTPPEAKVIVKMYVDDWEEFDKVTSEIEENQVDIEEAKADKDPLLKEKYELDRKVLLTNRRLRISHLAKLFRLLNANKIFPEGIEIVGEKEYRALGVGKIFAVPERIVKRERTMSKERTQVQSEEEGANKVE